MIENASNTPTALETVYGSSESDQRSMRDQLNAGIERGRERARELVSSAQQHPWTTAAIAGGIVATAAAATAGAVMLKRRLDKPEEAADHSAEITSASRAPSFSIVNE